MIFVKKFFVATICLFGFVNSTGAQWLDHNKEYVLNNGISFNDFSYSYVLKNGKATSEFDLTTDQIKKLKKLIKEFEEFREKSFELALKTHERKLMKQIKPRVSANELQWEESYRHYKRAWKVLAPHQRKRLDQILTWSGRGKRGCQFAEWSNAELVNHWELDDDQIRSLIEITGQAEKQYRQGLSSFRLAQTEKIFAVLSKNQKRKYVELIDPNRKINEVRTASFPPFNLLMSADFKLEREVRLIDNQYLDLVKIAHKYGLRSGEVCRSIDIKERNAYRDIIRFEVYRDEFATKIEELLNPKQRAVVEKYYVRQQLQYYGPAGAIFDPAIAARSGISMSKLKSMKKLRAKLSRDESRKKSELIRAGFKFILQKVGKDTRGKIKKYFGDLPQH